MKKIAFLLIAAVGMGLISSCETKKEKENAVEITTADSLQQILSQKEGELSDMVSTLNEIQDGFRKINEAQGRISVERQKGEQNQKAAIIEDMQVIQHTMRLNQELIANLRQQVKESKSSNSALRKTMEATIASLTAQLDDLTGNVNELAVQNETKARTVASQDKELNTAYYVFGTKRELKDQNILSHGEVLQNGNFNKDYFTKIDIRVDKVIHLYSKSARLMTTHPSDSYSLDKDAKGQYTLRITDPTRFWSVSKYLVITVK